MVQEPYSKANFSFWLAIQNKILTIENLHKRGFVIPNRCYLCESQLETSNHFFLCCSFAQRNVLCSSKIVGVKWVAPESFQDLCLGWNPPSRNRRIRTLKNFSLTHFACSNWKEQNAEVFRNEKKTPKVVTRNMFFTILENISIMTFKDEER